MNIRLILCQYKYLLLAVILAALVYKSLYLSVSSKKSSKRKSVMRGKCGKEVVRYDIVFMFSETSKL